MNKTTFTLLLLGSLTATAYAENAVVASPTDEQSKASLQESSMGEKTSADKKPSADEEPLADKKPPADEESSADKKPSADEEPSADKKPSADEEPSADKKQLTKEEQATVDDQQEKAAAKESSVDEKQSSKEAASANKTKPANRDQQQSADLIKNAAKRGTPPWTNDSANIHLQLSRTPADEDKAQPYSAEDFTVKPEWERLFANDEHFSTNSGEELYQTMCQACHMADGQGAQGAGHFPSFVGNERLRSPDYPIDVVLNGFRGMPHFGDMLSNQQVADVVNHLRTHFGNQLVGDSSAEDVARVRQEN